VLKFLEKAQETLN